MEKNRLICPNCGAEIKEGANGVCEHCGATYSAPSAYKKFDIRNCICFGVTSESEERLALPDGVKGIAENAFANMKFIREVSLPEGLEEISPGAFINCEHLETVNLPSSLKTIGAGAFKGCGLKKLTLPVGLQSIGVEAFMNCNELTDLYIPENSNLKFSKTFKKCAKLENANFSTNQFLLAFIPGTVVKKNSCGKSTLFDAFQGTPFFAKAWDAVFKQKTCFFCGDLLQKKVFSRKAHCPSCEIVFYRYRMY